MLGNFHPSRIENKIYDITEEFEIGCDLYQHAVTDKIAEWLSNLHVEYQLCCSDWPNEEGGVCAVAFVEDGYPHLVVFDYKY